MFDKLTPPVYPENNIKHTNIVEECEVFLSVYCHRSRHRKQNGAAIYGDL